MISFTNNENVLKHATAAKVEPVEGNYLTSFFICEGKDHSLLIDPLEDSMASPNSRPRTSTSSRPPFGKPSIGSSAGPQKYVPTNIVDEVLFEIDELDSTKSASKNLISLREESSSVQNLPPTGRKRSFPNLLSTTQEQFESASLSSSSSFNLSTLSARYLKLELENTWGDDDYMGLNGIEILGTNGNVLKINPKNILTDANSDLLSFGNGNEKPVENLVNGINNTTNKQFMWLVTNEENQSSKNSHHNNNQNNKHFVEFDLKKNENIAGIRIWNYNGGNEVSLRGCKYLSIYLDKKPYFRCILRPAPECDGIDFSQTIFFSHLAYEIESNLNQRPKNPVYITPRLKQCYETSLSITGMLWKFSFHTNHGDDYYIGLDHLEFYDNDNQLIDIERIGGKIAAVPYSVRDLSTSSMDPLQKDPRIPEQLLHSSYFTDQQKKTCWLCPLAKCMTALEKEAAVNRVVQNTIQNQDLYNKKKSTSIFPKDNSLFILFPYPVTVSAIRCESSPFPFLPVLQLISISPCSC